MHLSKYSDTRLRHILEGGDEAELEKFKRRFQIAYCKRVRKVLSGTCLYPEPGTPFNFEGLDELEEQLGLEEVREPDLVLESEPFWMIYRGLRRKKTDQKDVAFHSIEPSLIF